MEKTSQNENKRIKTAYIMDLKDYISYENRYFEKMVGCETWKGYTDIRDRYIQFVTKCCRWEKVRAISRKRYKGLNDARCKHFAYEAKYMPFDREKIELYEKFQFGCCHKKRQNKNKGIFGRSDAFSPTKGITYPPKRK